MDMKWKKIWNAREVDLSDPQAPLDIAHLIELNGFDTGAGDYSAAQYAQTVQSESERHQITASSHVFEVGCGSGALLKVLQQQIECQVSGCDFSENLVKVANSITASPIQWAEANAFNLEPSVDVILSHSVFQYFPSHDYAKQVIQRMYSKLRPGGTISVMDVNDAALKADYHEFRASFCESKETYERLYLGETKHMFYQKEWLTQSLTAAGFKDVAFFEHVVKSYKNSQYRFNVFAVK